MYIINIIKYHIRTAKQDRVFEKGPSAAASWPPPATEPFRPLHRPGGAQRNPPLVRGEHGAQPGTPRRVMCTPSAARNLATRNGRQNGRQYLPEILDRAQRRQVDRQEGIRTK